MRIYVEYTIFRVLFMAFELVSSWFPSPNTTSLRYLFHMLVSKCTHVYTSGMWEATRV